MQLHSFKQSKISSQHQSNSSQDGLPAPQIYWAWATLMIGLTLSVLDGTIANVALPTIARDFLAPQKLLFGL